MPDIFDYMDYRQFLRDYCEERRRENPHFSYRYLSQKMGIRSTGFLSMVVAGKRTMSEESAAKLARLLKLTKKESDFFICLVRFNQAHSHEEKQRRFGELLVRQKGPVRRVTRDQYEFYDKWYYSAIRELVAIHPVRDNFDEVAKMLRPTIKPAEARAAIEKLELLGMIERDADGFFHRRDAVITSGPAFTSFAIQQFQRQTVELAKSSGERFVKEARQLATLTMSIDGPAYTRIIDRLAHMRQEIMEMARSVDKPDWVYQLNMQIYPLSEKVERHGNT